MRPFVLLAGFILCAEAQPATIQGKNGKVFRTGLVHYQGEEKACGKTHVKLTNCDNLPSDFDLKDVGVSLPIYNQGDCGSCWAFSKTSSLESAAMAMGKPYQRLSEQELISCDESNNGCNGGARQTVEYQVTHGQGLYLDYPYQERRTRCRSPKMAVKATDFVDVGSPDHRPTVQEVQCALYKSHTIPWITVAANDRWPDFPKGQDDVITTCGSGMTNHAIGVTGWRTINGQVYFRVRNSWGTDWGYQGTALLPLGCDNLGEEVSYIITNAMQCKPPKVKLPITVDINPGDTVVIAVEDLKQVTYAWSKDGKKVPGTKARLKVSPTKDSFYKLKASNSCGSAETQTEVRIRKSH